MTMMPAPETVRATLPLEPGLLARLIPVTDPQLYTGRPDESPDERAARLAAAADITDDLLAEQAELAAEEITGGSY
jgi:hypothetical protein